MLLFTRKQAAALDHQPVEEFLCSCVYRPIDDRHVVGDTARVVVLRE